MAFQIDTFQADAFQTLISHPPFIIPMYRRRVTPRVTASGITILTWKATLTGDIDEVHLWIPANPSVTSAILNVEIAGVPVFAGGARPTFATGVSYVQKLDVDYAITLGQEVEITVEQCPAEGISVPIDALIRVRT